MTNEEPIVEEDVRAVETESDRLDRLGIYGEIKRELVKRGIPSEEIAFIHDFDTPARKAQAFADANAGRIRVMLASTEKAGTGVNMQQRLYAIHHGDGPWRPSDVEQRDGRILRQGNQYPEVRIFTYVTEGSFDGFVWQTLENKARFISQIMSGEVTARTTEDVDDMVMTAAQVKAIASGNPRILERVSIEVELSRLSRLYSVWRNGRRHLKWEMESLPGRIREADLRVAGHEQALSLRDQNLFSDGAFEIRLKRSAGGDEWLDFGQRAQAGEHLNKLRREVAVRLDADYCAIGSYRGFQILAQRQRGFSETFLTPVEGFLCLADSKILYPFNFGDSAQGTIQSIDAQFRAIDSHLQRALKAQAELRHKKEMIQTELAGGWSYAAKYAELQAQLQRVNQQLNEDGSQIDDRQEFAALDQDAFQHCEPHAEGSIPPAENILGEIPAPPTSEEKVLPPPTGQSIVTEQLIVAEHPCHQITLDDLRNQPPQKDKRKPSSTPRTSSSAQLSLWQ
ncbi:MAG: helicase-related protein [Blastocatellia bacterium]